MKSFFNAIGKSRFNKVALTGYKTVSYVMLLSLAALILSYGALLSFFAVNSTWVVPTVMNTISKDMLTFTAGYQQAQQNLMTLQVTHDQSVRDYSLALDTYDKLVVLNEHVGQYNTALNATAPVKNAEFKDQEGIISSLESVKKQTEMNAKLGLVTNDVVVETLSSIAQFKAATTDGRTNWSTVNITARASALQLQQQIIQARNDIQTKQDIVNGSAISVTTAKQAVDSLEHSIYYTSFQHRGANLAFLPYDNMADAKIGAPVYGCSLMFIICHQVGTIKTIYPDEQLIAFPLFNARFSSQIRGVIAELNVPTSDDMKKNLVLYVGSKPVWF